MKLLVACHAGICRSAAMSNELKHHGFDALVVGLGYNKPETVRMLTDWADKIVVMQKELVDFVPMPDREKVVVADVGPDVWKNSADPDLRNRVKVIVDSWLKNGTFDHVTIRPKAR